MLVRADAIPLVEMIKSAEAVDAEAALLWLHMGLWDSLGEMIDEARPEIDAVWKSVVAAKSDRARGILVRQAVERRIDGDEIDDIVKAAAGLSLVRGYVAKAEDADTRRRAQANEPRERGRYARRAKESTNSEGDAYDMTQAFTQRNDGLRTGAEGVAEQLTGTRYDQMRVVGNALVASGHPKAQIAGGAVRIAAEVGPSAEDVLGTHLRRAAYRYRGTEKRPDRALVRETAQARGIVALHVNGNEADRSRVEGALARRQPGEAGKGSAAYRLAQSQAPGTHLTEDQLEMLATGDVAVAHLMHHLPSKDEASLSQEAGRTPPSLGVIIDRDGDVVSESMGYQGDHYLPFDLKNLKRLQGGSYVRTRAVGGPTSEDIYTGLLTGARQMQVVSRSGVFTVEFDPDLRGGRRYSDKARQMVDRYSRLLDVVEGGKDRSGETIYTNDIDPDRRRELERQALVDSDYDEDESKVRLQRLLRRERAQAAPGYTEAEIDRDTDAELQEWVGHQQQAPSQTEIGRMRDQIRTETRDRYRSEREQKALRKLKLNAEGYYRALQSLQREFPYYVRSVDYETLRDFEDRRRTNQPGRPLDLGSPTAGARRSHVQRGNLVPAEQAETYGTKQRPGRTKPAPPAEEGGDTATVGGPKAPKGGAPAEGGATFEATLRDERFQDHVAHRSSVLKVANMTHGDPASPLVELPKPDNGRMDREYASALEPMEFVKWVSHPDNTITHGDSDKIARYLTEEASPGDLKRISEGLEQIASSGELPPIYSKDKVREYRRLLDAIGRAREPYAESGGSAALHQPLRDDPKPYPFPEVTRSAMVDSDHAFEKEWRKSVVDNDIPEDIVGWAKSGDDDEIGAALRREVQRFNAAKEWGEKRIKAKADRIDPADYPVKPGDTGSIDAEQAEEIANNPETTKAYKDLRKKQIAYAWEYTKRLRDTLRGVMGGGAAPKVERPAIESGEKSARLVTSSRRVVWHRPDEPLSQALAKRLSRSRRPITGR